MLDLEPSIFGASPSPSGIEPDLKVGFILSPAFSILPLAGFVDCLRHAADVANRSRQIYCRWAFIAPDLAPIRASCGIEVMPQQLLPDPGIFDYVVMVGGLLPGCLEQPPAVFDYLRACQAKNVPIIGLCTGSFVMAKAGLLDGRRCAVHFEHRQELSDLFPEVIPISDESYVMDQGLITCPGGTAAIDLAVELVKQHCGKARAVKGLLSMLVDPHRVAHHLPHRPYEDLAGCGNWRVEQAVQIMERNLGRTFGIDVLAARLGTSIRELDRAFARHAGTAPAAFWRKMRLGHGHWLLLNTSRSVTQVAHECGFADTAHFSRWFKRTYGETPRAFRTRRYEIAKPRAA